MKLELKNIKHAAFASEETHCFEAVLYLDGQPVAHISNEGRGGSDHVVPHERAPKGFWRNWRETMEAIDAHFANLPKSKLDLGDGRIVDIDQSLEIWTSEQINEWLARKDFKRRMKAKILAKFADGIYGWKKAPALDKQIALIKQKYAADNITILNELDDEAAFAIYREATK
jgi:hypothetical protein